MISFAILLALLVKFAFPPVAGMLQKRSEKIRADLEAAETARREAEALDAERRAALENARAEGQRIIEDARATGQALREEAVRAAQQEANAIKEQADRQLEAERARLVLELRTELSATAVELAGRILAKELSGDEVDPLVQQFLQESGWS